MILINSTKNQHFVSQVEQRLNSNNPNAQDRNKRIFSFRVEDRESYSVVLESMDGCKISSNLSLNDIFSFDVVDGSSYRYNFEEIFHQYEKDIKKILKV